MTDEQWETECYLAPDGTRMCFKTKGALVQLPREFLDQIVAGNQLKPTAAPGEESPQAAGPHKLANPVFVHAHEHSWRKTSSTHNGLYIYQCRVCEDAAIEGAER